MSMEWEKQEPGWYTSRLGGVVEELDGWWFYPIGETAPAGPFGSMKAAKQMATEPAVPNGERASG